MILIEWYQTDWFFYLPIILAILLVAILFLRVLRRATRWRAVDISHVWLTKDPADSNGLIFYIRKDSMEEPPEVSLKKVTDPTVPSILLILPLGTDPENKNYFASSLAVAGWNVIVLPSSSIISWINDQQFDINFKNLLIKYSISAGIIFDFACPLILQYLNNNPNPIRWIFMRLTWSWENIQSLKKSIPFSVIWWAKIGYQSFRKQISKQIYLDSMKSMHNITAESLLTDKKLECYLIQPSSTWLDKEGNRYIDDLTEILNRSEKFRSVQIDNTDWTFYPQETIVMGWILRFLSTQNN